MGKFFSNYKDEEFLVISGGACTCKTGLLVNLLVEHGLEGKNVCFLSVETGLNNIIPILAEVKGDRGDLAGVSVVQIEEDTSTVEDLKATILESGKPDILIVDNMALLVGYLMRSMNDIIDMFSDLSSLGIQIIISRQVSREIADVLGSKKPTKALLEKEPDWAKRLHNLSTHLYIHNYEDGKFKVSSIGTGKTNSLTRKSAKINV